jgi:hypothetical protein
MAREHRARARHPRSVPAPTHPRHPRRIDPIPGAQPRATPTRGALRVSRRSISRDPSLGRRLASDETHALDRAPRPVRAQKVAGELRAPRARARHQGVRRRSRGRRSLGALSRGARSARRRNARRPLAQVARRCRPLALTVGRWPDAPWTPDGQAEGEGAGR